MFLRINICIFKALLYRQKPGFNDTAEQTKSLPVFTYNYAGKLRLNRGRGFKNVVGSPKAFKISMVAVSDTF